jgi:maleate isomerase
MSAMREHYGWRARIGIVYPDTGTVMEPECYAMAPAGVSIHTDRLPLSIMTVDGIGDMMKSDATERCTASLAEAPLHAIVFGGTSATFLKGMGYDEEIKARMARVARGIPVTTASSAALKALRRLGVTKLSFVAPYDDEVTARGVRFFEQNGFAVPSHRGLGLRKDKDVGAVSLERVYHFTRAVAHKEADGVFISCTNLRSVGAIAALEADLGVPVVSAIQASFWDALRLAGVRASKPGFGRLFDF